MDEKEGKKIKYAFGLDEEECFTDTFDTVEELIAFARDAYEHPDGNYWDEDMDEYPTCIFIGVADTVTASQYAPSLDDIVDQMTDKFYCEYNLDNDEEVRILNRKDADADWEAFIEKHFSLPCSIVTSWIGVYDLKNDKWFERYGVKLEGEEV